jgi:hypothetical protein
MKRISTIILSGILFISTSCHKYLDVNQNVNSATTSTPELVLPQAIVYTASVTSTYNSYGAQVGGYMANAYGVGGFGDNFSYTFTSSDYTGLWSASYDVLEDLQFIIDSSKGKPQYNYFSAAATILKVYNFQILADTYNNIPFSQALKGKAIITPAYDDAKTIYPALSNLLDSAIALINATPLPNGTATSTIALSASTDPLFKGTIASWKQLANTLKLKLIIRAAAKITMPSTTFDAAGFLTTDAIINPGYGRTVSSNGSTQVNPAFNTWIATYSGSKGNRSWVPTKYVFAYYNGTKLTDTKRGTVTFYSFPSTGVSQLGVLSYQAGSANGNTGNWYYSGFTNSGTGVAAGTTPTTVGNTVGVFKGPDMGQPLMLASESYFLQSEAIMRGITTVAGLSDVSAFNSGVTQSFNYLYKLANGSFSPNYPATQAATDFAAYQSANSTKYLVNYALATTAAQKLEAIITQKYIALNMIHSHEGWNEYRRTGYPVSDGTQSPYTSFASLQSSATAADKLPTRIQYPSSEFSYNSNNVPGGGTATSPAAVSVFTDKIFWAK